MQVSVIDTPSFTKAAMALRSSSSMRSVCPSCFAFAKSVPRGSVMVGIRTRRLRSFVAARVVTPVQTPQGHAFSEADLARLQLLCDLSEVYDLPADALIMVMSLIDQLNTARGDMRALIQAVANEPDEVRGRIMTYVRSIRMTGRG